MKAAKPKSPEKLRVLSFDIGGTGLKGAIVDGRGKMLTARKRIPTPHPCPPPVMIDALAELASTLPAHDCIAAGFPGVIRKNVVLTAPNLGTEDWSGFNLGKALTRRLGKPAMIANDADVAGLAVIERKGLEMMITLGTGFGTGLYRDGALMPHLELAHHPVHKDKTYDEWLGNAALKKAGHKHWNKRVKEAIALIAVLVNFDRLYIGGGNARHIKFKLPPHVRTVSNDNGIEGGGFLWSYAGSHRHE